MPKSFTCIAVVDGREFALGGTEPPHGILEPWPEPEMDEAVTPVDAPTDPSWTPHRAGFYDACDGRGFRRTIHSLSVPESAERDARCKAEHAALVAGESRG